MPVFRTHAAALIPAIVAVITAQKLGYVLGYLNCIYALIDSGACANEFLFGEAGDLSYYHPCIFRN